jgi:glucosamine-6-phosphate deaminase
VEDGEELSQRAAALIIEKVKQKPNAVLGLATGSTPKGTYKELIRDHQLNGTSYARVKTINLDEYVGLPADHPNSYHYFMRTNLFDHLDFSEGNHFIPEGLAKDLDAACQDYEERIHSNPIDLQLLGIGQNGHIGFNEPGTPFNSTTHRVQLTRSTRKANARFFDHFNEVPKEAITMGISSILQSKEIILLASGSNKAEAIYRLLKGPITEAFPASALNKHDKVTIIADREALSYQLNPQHF